jgi:fatty acid CoA ligase FadD9
MLVLGLVLMADWIVRWTPGEAWLMAELAKRALVASAPGGIEIEIVAGDEIVLVITLDTEQTTIAFLPQPVANHRWRPSWLLELVRGDERWILGPGRPAIEISGREPVCAHLRLEMRALERELAGRVESVPLSELACHRYTRQSTVIPVTNEPLLPWAAPTEPEPAPWWELDLARAVYVAWLRIDLVRPPVGTRVVVRAYGFVDPAGAPPPDSVLCDVAAESLDGDDIAWLVFDAGVVARYLRVELVAATPVTLEVTATEVFAAELHAQDLEASLRRAFAIHRDRPVIEARAADGTYRPELRYGELWTRAMALADGLARRLEPRSDRITLAIMTGSRPEWLMADLAALVRGYVVVPIDPQDADDRLAIILGRARPTVVICEPADVARLARLAPDALAIACGDPLDGTMASTGPVPARAPRRPSDLHAVLFTSGSTGVPKGAMRSYETFFAMISSYAVAHSPRHLSFQPLSHLSERMYLPTLLLHGGTLAFSRGGAHLLDELRTFEPTTIGTVPRLFEVLYASYQRRLRAALAEEPDVPRATHEARALAEARAAFGHKLSAVSVGSAPVSAEVLAFLRRCFADLWVSEGYGSTEVGTIANDGKVLDSVAVKLVPLPDAAPPDPGEPERGEIHVHSPHAILGYLGDPDATAAAFDAERYFATGDLGERDAEGRVRVIGRVRNTVKLAQGEFVSAERIETALSSASIVDRIFVHVENGATGVAALVVPQRDALARALEVDGELAVLVAHPGASRVVLAALRAQARASGLAAYEVPRAVIVEATPFAVDNGLLTANGKLARGTLVARYGKRLAALAAGNLGDSVASHEPARDDTLGTNAVVARVVAAVLGREVDLREPLAANAGVDSLAAAEILAALSDTLGREVPLAWWFESDTLEDLATRIERFSSGGVSAARALAAADLALETPSGQSGSARPIRTVLVTGATGFLGARLVESLCGRGIEVIALVRAADDRAAHDRLAGVLERRSIDANVHAIAGDLARPGLGVSERELERVDAVVHAGATVSWLASYAALREPNVLGTLEVLRLAARHGWSVHHVSTISVAPADGDESSMLTFDAALGGTPYGLSKWIAEQHVRRAAGPGTIYRPAMIAGDTRRGTGNPDDFVNRYLVGCRELGMYVDLASARIDLTPVDFVADAIAACVGACITGKTVHLANTDQSPSYAELGRALVAAGLPLRPASYAEFRLALLAARTSRLRPLAAFFPETCSLAMGPWPCAASVALVAGLGVSRPQIDAALVARYVAALR